MATESETTKPTAETPIVPLLLTRAQAAQALNVSQMTIFRLLQRGDLKRKEGLRKILIPREQIEKFASV